jgi:hypothetical protein
LIVFNPVDGQIKKYQFDATDVINAQFNRNEISGTDFYEIEKQYNEWKQKQ